MRLVSIVPIMRCRKAHPRLGLGIGGCCHVTLLTHYENVIPGELQKNPATERKKNMSIRGVESLIAIKNISSVNKCF